MHSSRLGYLSSVYFWPGENWMLVSGDICVWYTCFIRNWLQICCFNVPTPIAFNSFQRNVLIPSLYNHKRSGFILGLNISGDDCGFIQELCYHRHFGRLEKKKNLYSFDNRWKKKSASKMVSKIELLNQIYFLIFKRTCFCWNTYTAWKLFQSFSKRLVFIILVLDLYSLVLDFFIPFYKQPPI